MLGGHVEHRATLSADIPVVNTSSKQKLILVENPTRRGFFFWNRHALTDTENKNGFATFRLLAASNLERATIKYVSTSIISLIENHNIIPVACGVGHDVGLGPNCLIARFEQMYSSEAACFLADLSRHRKIDDLQKKRSIEHNPGCSPRNCLRTSCWPVI